MIIGVPKEIKNNENRVGLTPAGTAALTAAGHRVLIEEGAGRGSGFDDAAYIEAGAAILADKRELFATAEMIVKVKEPLPPEYDLFRPGQILFTYLHLAPERELTLALLKREVIGIAYETIEGPGKSLPLLSPMSEIAGRMAVQVGAQFLERPYGGRDSAQRRHRCRTGPGRHHRRRHRGHECGQGCRGHGRAGGDPRPFA